MEIVNGYVCRNCTDTALAARNIDPAHPKDGPFGNDRPKDARDPAVVLDGLLKGRAVSSTSPVTRPSGAILDLSA